MSYVLTRTVQNFDRDPMSPWLVVGSVAWLALLVSAWWFIGRSLRALTTTNHSPSDR